MVKSSVPPYPDALPAATRLGCYELDKVLGQGGFAITYLAKDTYLDQPVAIKEYLPIELAQRGDGESVRPRTIEQQDSYERGLHRFLFEARTLARFDHPNIVRVLSVFEQNGTAYMVMRYESGAALSALLDTRHTLPEPQLLGILIPILHGIELVHDAKFIHRDIKPENIYIRDDNSPVLLDFGAARQAFGQPVTMTALVTSGYTPFEQYQSDSCGPWTDIYSLGATCYRAIAGFSPVDALARVKSSLGSLEDPLIPARVVGRGRYSEPLLNAIDDALKILEKERPQSIRQWREAIAPSKPSAPVASEPNTGGKGHASASSESTAAAQGAGRSNDHLAQRRTATNQWSTVGWAAGASVLASLAVVFVWLGIQSAKPPSSAGSESASPPVAQSGDAQHANIPQGENAAKETTTLLAAAPQLPRSGPQAPASTPAPVRATVRDRAPSSKPALPPLQGPSDTPPQATPLPAMPQVHEVAAAGRLPSPVAGPRQMTSSAEPTALEANSESPTLAPIPGSAAATTDVGSPNGNPPKSTDISSTSGGVASKTKAAPAEQKLASLGDSDAMLRLGQAYADGMNGHPNHLFAYVYFKLALLSGNGQARQRLAEQTRKLQPPEVKQADAIVESMQRSQGDLTDETQR